jgi:flavin reductase (DIM6/NTAB) family NADH-FMN oxidoreductase RutF
VLETRARQEFTARELRDALGHFATGVTVVTTRGEESAYGMTANAFTSVSLDPPLVLVCVVRGTDGSRHIAENKCFAVNVLAAHQEPISRYFSSRDRPRGRDAFREISHTTLVSGSPIIDDSAAYLDCVLSATYEAGDHLIFIGEVVALGTEPEADPLVFHGGRYRLVGEA